MLFNIVLASAICQHESAIGIHMTPPSWMSLTPPTPSHPTGLSQSTGFELPESYNKFLLVIYFAYSNLYVSMLLSLFILPLLTPQCPQVYSLCLLSSLYNIWSRCVPALMTEKLGLLSLTIHTYKIEVIILALDTECYMLNVNYKA